MWSGAEDSLAKVVCWYVCYALAGQEVKVEETFRQLRQLEEASKLRALILMGHFSQSNITGRAIEMQEIFGAGGGGGEGEERENTLLELLFKSNEELVEGIKVDGSLGYSDYEMLEFKTERSGKDD